MSTEAKNRGIVSLGCVLKDGEPVSDIDAKLIKDLQDIGYEVNVSSSDKLFAKHIKENKNFYGYRLIRIELLGE